MKAYWFLLFFIVILVSGSERVFGDREISAKGFVDTIYGFSLKSDHRFLNEKTRARLGFEITDDNTYFYVSVNAVTNKVTDYSGLKLHEAFCEFTGEKWDLRIGRQIIAWGKADGLRITDLISPSDMSEFIAQEFDDIRMPVDAVKFRLLFEKMNLEFIYIPVFTPGIMPEQGSLWYISSGNSINIGSYRKPEKKFLNSEYAVKFSLFLKGVDLAFSVMNLWDDFPLLSLADISTDEYFYEYYRYRAFGAEASVPLGNYVFRFETAYIPRISVQGSDYRIFKKSRINWLSGIDWYPGNNWIITAQITGKSILKYSKVLAEKKNKYVSTLNISKKVLRERLSLSNMLYLDLSNGDLMDRFTADFALTDDLHIFAGFDIFAGNKEGDFGRYRDNTQCWFKAKYSF